MNYKDIEMIRNFQKNSPQRQLRGHCPATSFRGTLAFRRASRARRCYTVCATILR